MTVYFYYSHLYGMGNFERVKKISIYFEKKKIKSKLIRFKSNLNLKEKSIFDLHPNDFKRLKRIRLQNGLIINSFDKKKIRNFINIFPGPHKYKKKLNCYYGKKFIVNSIKKNKKNYINKKYDFFVYLSSQTKYLKITKQIIKNKIFEGKKIYAPLVNTGIKSQYLFQKSISLSKNFLISGGLTRYDLMAQGKNFNILNLDSTQKKINNSIKKIFGYGNSIGELKKFNINKLKVLNDRKKINLDGEMHIYRIYCKFFFKNYYSNFKLGV